MFFPARAEAVLKPVFNELCYNLESFNPAFTSCLLMVGALTHYRLTCTAEVKHENPVPCCGDDAMLMGSGL